MTTARSIDAQSAAPSRAARVSREEIIAALHGGMRRAIQEFERWTDGESLSDWGVEPLLTTSCARAVRGASRRAGGRLSITLEQDFYSLLSWSERRSPKGRPRKAAQRLLDSPRRKVDLVIWNGNETPRAVVEVKRADTLSGLLADAERLTDFVEAAGKAYQGTIRRGFLAFIVQHHIGRTHDQREQKIEHRLNGLKRYGGKRGFKVRFHGPTNVDAPGLRDYCCVQTVVVEFSRPRSH